MERNNQRYMITKCPSGVKKRRLCRGKNDTCSKRGEKNGLCISCKNQLESSSMIKVGGVMMIIENGKRFVIINGRKRRYCEGKDNKCEKLVTYDDYCESCVVQEKFLASVFLKEPAK